MAPIRPWILGPIPKGHHAPQRTLAPEGRLGPDEGFPWAPSPAPLRGQGPLGSMGPFGDRPMAEGSMAYLV